MAFSYVVPLSAFTRLFGSVDRALHPELAERLRAEIHGDVARRVIGPSTYTPMGSLNTAFDSSVSAGEIVFYSPMDFDDARQKSGEPRTGIIAGPRPPPQPQTLKSMMDRRWRYPGDGGNGIFAASVNAVAARAPALKDEFAVKSRQMRGDKG